MNKSKKVMSKQKRKKLSLEEQLKKQAEERKESFSSDEDMEFETLYEYDTPYPAVIMDVKRNEERIDLYFTIICDEQPYEICQVYHLDKPFLRNKLYDIKDYVGAETLKDLIGQSVTVSIIKNGNYENVELYNKYEDDSFEDDYFEDGDEQEDEYEE